MADNIITSPRAVDLKALDEKLSRRFIELDPDGYFLIYIDFDHRFICAEHFTNTINDKGLACDPETGEPFPCDSGLQRTYTHRYKGRTAKELCIAIFEAPNQPSPISRLDHAAYLGREFIRAEMALISGSDYVQD